ADDRATFTLLEPLNDPATQQAVLAERSLLKALGGGCQVPIGAATVVSGDTLTLRGVVIRPDGTRRIEAQRAGPRTDPEEIGRQLGGELLTRGAAELLKE